MFSPQIHRYIFLFGIFALGFGMMMGTVPTSVPQLILMGNWLLEMDFKNKWQRLKGNFIFWMLSSVFLMHAFGLLYSSDLAAGWNDVRTKIPLMFLPLLLFSSAPISVIEFRRLLYCFLLGCVCNTAWCITYTHILHKNEGVRNASRFMSHIRLGLYLNVAIAICVYLFRRTEEFKWRLLFTGLAVYFVFSFYALGLVSGMVNFVLLVVLFLLYLSWSQKAFVKFSVLALLVIVCFSVVRYLDRIKDEQLQVVDSPANHLQNKTPWGSSYIHFDTIGQKENGYYVLINLQLEELKEGWARRMPADTFNYQTGHNIQRYEVLARYLASKGLTKDSAAVASLTGEDVQNIHNNIFNYNYPSWSFLHRRVYEAVNEYDEFVNNRHVNGHSLTMRLYFWKAALHVISLHPITGVGTGDVQSSLNTAYIETKSPLHEEWYKRPHNQFLTIWLALGIFGLLIFICSIFYPAIKLRRQLHVLYWPFLFLALVSFMVEDTLETQAGLTFYAFFSSLFISLADREVSVSRLS